MEVGIDMLCWIKHIIGVWYPELENCVTRPMFFRHFMAALKTTLARIRGLYSLALHGLANVATDGLYVFVVVLVA